MSRDHQSKISSIVEFVLDNIFDLATLLVALVVVLVHQVHPFDLVTLISWILAVLALLAISGLWDRNRRLRRLETLLVDTTDILHQHLAGRPRADSFFITETYGLIAEMLSSAMCIYICGLTLTRTTRQFMDILSRRLEAGATIRLALLDPSNSALMQIMASRSMGTTSAEYWTIRLNTVVDVIHAIAESAHGTGKLEIGFSPFPPSFGLILTDPDEEHGKCIVELYHHKTAEKNAAFVLSRASDPYWFAFFYRQWTELWKSCRIETVVINRQPVLAEGSK
jgi:hypothetical protein